MKHFTLLLMAAATICTNAFAQNRAKNIYTSTTELNLEVLQNQAQPVVLNRTLFAGYNTICLPMSLSAEQLQAAAKDVQVERLETIRQEGNTLNMYFLDCTNEGIEAGVPYLIFSPTFRHCMPTPRTHWASAPNFGALARLMALVMLLPLAAHGRCSRLRAVMASPHSRTPTFWKAS